VDALAIAYERVWDSFQQSGSTEDGRHDTARWIAQSGPYAACVIRVPAEAVHPKLAFLREKLVGLSGVRLHPDHFLHIMLQELGFVVDLPRYPDELSGDRLEEFAQAATVPISNMSAFPIRLGGANSFQDAVFLDACGSLRLLGLHERLFDLAAIPSAPDYPYLPHCTIAHYDGTTPHEEARRLIGPWRNEAFGEFMVTEAEIVTLDTREPYPELATYAVIPFEG
jgi:RNA 2',3'-cyclic 3'-phosphodiesterase